MNFRPFLFRATAVLFALAGVSSLQLQAAAPDAQVEAVLKRMRDTLRTTMTQLQTSEAEKATLQTQLAESDQKNKDLEARIAELNKKFDAQTKQMVTDKTASEKSISDLNFSLANRDREVARLNESLVNWKKGYDKAVAQIQKSEAQRAEYAAKAVAADRKVAERERQNLELYNTGKEILTRYENFGLGGALLAREPFVGTARVKLQNQVQDYRDKLQDQKVKPSDKNKAAAAEPASHAKPASAAAGKPMPTAASKAPDPKSKSS